MAQKTTTYAAIGNGLWVRTGRRDYNPVDSLRVLKMASSKPSHDCGHEKHPDGKCTVCKLEVK